MDGRTARHQGDDVDPADIAARTATRHAALSDARAWIRAHDAECIRNQIAVTEIPAPTGDESARAAWMAEQFIAAGLVNVHEDAAGNIIGTHEGRAPTPAVVICAHLDTVFPREAISRVHHADGATRLVAPGIGDNGRGLAALLTLARVMHTLRITTSRPVRFVATTGEEGRGDLRGARHHIGSGERPHAVVALDGTGDERIVCRAVASRRLRVTLRGPGGHSWSDYGNANPLHAMAAAIARATSAELPTDPAATLTVSRTGSGVSVNAIPPDAWFEADIRSVSGDAVRRVEQMLRGAVQAAATAESAAARPGTGALSVEIQVIGDRPGGMLASNAPIVAVAAAATRLESRTPVLATGSTDANVPLSMGIPAIAIGGGGTGGDVHRTTEWFENADGWRGVSRALTIVATLAH